MAYRPRLVSPFGVAALLLAGACTNLGDHPLGELHIVSAEELDALADSGVLSPLGEVDPEAEQAAREQAEAEALAIVEDYLLEHPEATDKLMWEIESPNVEHLADGNVLVEVPATGQPVILHGVGKEHRSDAAVIETLADRGAHQAILELLHPLAPAHCRSRVVGEASWDGLDLEELVATNRTLASCWSEWRTFAHPFDDDEGPVVNDEISPPTNTGSCDMPFTIVAGGGNDGGAWCGPTNAMVNGFVHKASLSQVRDQAARGSCVAFGTVSALEYATHRLSHTRVDLSEQTAYAVGKWDFEHEHYGDGLPTADFVKKLGATGVNIPLETSWGYNPSWCRQDLEDEKRYLDSCVNYENDACSESAHQLGLYSTGPNDPVQLWRPVSLADGQYVEVAQTYTLGLFDLFLGGDEIMNAAVDAGWGAVAALKVTEDFMNANDTGFLPNVDDSNVGGHAVQVVRVVHSSNAAGGRWVVIKNSWSCGWGDGGYGYLSRDWFDDHMKSVTFVRPRRTIFNTPPDVDVTTPSGTVTQPVSGFGNTIQLVASVTDAERGSDCCDITWFSTLDGDLGTGASITATLRGEGTRTIVVTARDEYGALDQDTVVVVLTNQAPDAEITRPAWEPAPGSLLGLKVPVGVHVPYSGVAPDPNDLFQQVPCEQRTWTFTTDQGEAQSFGCASNTAFTALGWVRVTMEASDSGGATGSDTLWVQAVQWPEDALPFAMISSPSQDDFFVSDPGQAWFLKASVASGTGADPTVRWALENPFTHQEFAEIGTGATLRWTPSDFVGFTCGGASVDLVMEATDANGTTVDRLSMYLFYSPC